MQDTPRFITEQQLSEATGMSLSHIRNQRWNRTGIPYYKLGRSVRYRLDEVIQWMEEHRINVGCNK